MPKWVLFAELVASYEPAECEYHTAWEKLCIKYFVIAHRLRLHHHLCDHQRRCHQWRISVLSPTLQVSPKFAIRCWNIARLGDATKLMIVGFGVSHRKFPTSFYWFQAGFHLREVVTRWRPALYFPDTEFHTFFSGHVPISSIFTLSGLFRTCQAPGPAAESWPDCSLQAFP